MPVVPSLAPERPLWRDPEFRSGARGMVGVSMGLGAWGLVTGVAMVKSGLGVGLSVLMSLIVFAGSSQLAALPLIASGAPMWVVWATAFCVNLRFVIFSAQWRPYFGHFPRWKRIALGYFTADLNYVIFMQRFPEPRPAPEQVPYFLGGVATNWTAWQLPALVGILAAEQIPTAWGIGFAGTLALLGLIYSMVSDRATWISAIVAGAAAVAAYALPLKLNILVAIAAGVAVGLVIDHSSRRLRPLVEETT
jgi:predicted branched-subunit amino acid permease